MMTPERWQKVRDVLEQALELAPEKRSRFLDIACASDASLRQEVQSLLSAGENASSGFLESPFVHSSLLSPGTKLGDYEIVSQVGAGGMGVVYRARDLRLGRSVAIKVLRGHLWADAGRLRRFEQEAQAAASLNHPNILAIHQLGVYQGAPYLVSEFLEGATLREELLHGSLAPPRVLELAEQIAEGLSAAHQRGIIHRDLKPENLYVSKQGRIKILDFGLAKLLDEEDNPSAQVSQTLAGVIAGTVGYTSPEQVRGEKLDLRSDLFSFGVVLYEMAAGERPFTGATSGVTFEAILNRQPDPPSQKNPKVTAELERIITKAIEKDRDVRYQSAAEIRADLKRLKRDHESGRTVPSRIHSPTKKNPGSGTQLRSRSLALIFLVVAIAGSWLVYRPVKSILSNLAQRSGRSLRAEISAPPLTSFRLTGDNAGAPVISPNGDFVAFSATGKDGKVKLWIRALDAVDARSLPDTDGAFFPFWAPDSKWLAFFADSKLKAIQIDQGPPVAVCDAPDGRGGTWSADGNIVFAPTPTSGLLLVKSTGGTPQPITTLDGAKYTTHRWPFFLPDNQHLIYYAANHEPSRSRENAVYYASLDGREDRLLLHSDTAAVFAGGQLLSVAGNNLLARAFNFRTGELTGEPVLVATNAVNDPVTWHADVSASDAGVLVYGAVGTGSRQLVWLDSTSYVRTEVAVDGLSQLFYARLSRQGDRIALQKDREGHDLSVYNLRDKITELSLPKDQGNAFPAWSPDGNWITYSSFRDGKHGLYRIAADGTGTEQQLFTDDVRIMPTDWNGNTVFYARGALGNEFQCWAFSLDTKRRRKVLDNIDDCRVSPDGQWLAYSAFDSLSPGESHSRLKVYVVDVATGRNRHQVSEDSGLGPQWSQDGKEIYFLEQGTLALVRMEMRFRGGVPRFRLLGQSAPNLLAEPLYAISPDRKRILIERLPEPAVIVVANFIEGLQNK